MKIRFYLLVALVAGPLAMVLYATILNQIAYTIVPEALFAMRFFSPELQNRLGVLLMGISAEYVLLGLLTGIVLSIFHYKYGRGRAKSIYRALVAVLGIVLVVQLFGGFLGLQHTTLPEFAEFLQNVAPDNPSEFVFFMGMFNYLKYGVLVGLVGGSFYLYKSSKSTGDGE